MKIGKYIIFALAVSTASAQAYSQTSTDAAIAKANRFFEHAEWANANAMYTMLAHENPRSAELYGRAIVTQTIMGDSIRGAALVSQAMAHELPLDSILGLVKTYAYEAKHPAVYEGVMEKTAAQYPWLKRAIQARQLKYYDYRNDGAALVKCALSLLQGAPDNPTFLMALARGYMLQGQDAHAAAAWHKIIDTHPESYDALLHLANYYAQKPDSQSQALEYFTRAAAIKDTPYIHRQIESLGSIQR